MKSLQEFLNEENVYLNEGKQMVFTSMNKQGKAFIYKIDDKTYEFAFPEGYTLDKNAMQQLLKTLSREL